MLQTEVFRTTMASGEARAGKIRMSAGKKYGNLFKQALHHQEPHLHRIALWVRISPGACRITAFCRPLYWQSYERLAPPYVRPFWRYGPRLCRCWWPRFRHPVRPGPRSGRRASYPVRQFGPAWSPPAVGISSLKRLALSCHGNSIGASKANELTVPEAWTRLPARYSPPVVGPFRAFPPPDA